MFQSLIGTLKTLLPKMLCDLPAAFQSLIGTLKTVGTYAQRLCPYGFQSLIGTLKTYGAGGSGSGIATFQSLIGTLKTFTAWYWDKNKKSVSIPNRDAKNKRCVKLLSGFIRSFNP